MTTVPSLRVYCRGTVKVPRPIIGAWSNPAACLKGIPLEASSLVVDAIILSEKLCCVHSQLLRNNLEELSACILCSFQRTHAAAARLGASSRNSSISGHIGVGRDYDNVVERVNPKVSAAMIASVVFWPPPISVAPV